MINSFSDFGIKPTAKSFEGDKIKIERILNRTVEVHDYKIEPSKFEKGSGKRLVLQLFFDGDKRIVFTSSQNLMDMIQQAGKERLPFKTTIIKENGRLEFT